MCCLIAGNKVILLRAIKSLLGIYYFNFNKPDSKLNFVGLSLTYFQLIAFLLIASHG
jgi:hypothetical protein